MRIIKIVTVFVDATMGEIKAIVKQHVDRNLYEDHILEYKEGSAVFLVAENQAGLVATSLQGAFDNSEYMPRSTLTDTDKGLIVLRYTKLTGDLRASNGTRNQAKAMFN